MMMPMRCTIFPMMLMLTMCDVILLPDAFTLMMRCDDDDTMLMMMCLYALMMR
jgi:hypothetical protein